MKRHLLRTLMLMLLAALTLLLLATTVQAQTDINISNRNLVRVGGDVVIPAKQTVETALAIGGDVTLQPGARVTDSAIAIGGDVILEQGARVDGDAYSLGGTVSLGEGAVIAGNADTLEQNRTWTGEMHRGDRGFPGGYFFGLGSHLLTVAISTIVGLILLRWRPNFLVTLAATLRQYPLPSILWGLGGVVAVMLLVIVLAISLIGIPLLPLLGLVVAILALLGTLGVALWLGQITLKGPGRSPTQHFLVGILILAAIGFIPFLGGLVLSMANLFGLGALLAWQLGGHRPQATG